MSMPPKCASISATIRLTLSETDTSACTASASRPVRVISLQTALAASAPFPVVHSDMGTSLSQCDCNCGPDPATTPSHESNSIVQVFHGVIVCAGQHPITLSPRPHWDWKCD